MGRDDLIERLAAKRPRVVMRTSVRSGANRRLAATVGEGSAAIYTIHRYLETV